MPRLYKPGSFLRIPLADGSFGYGRVLNMPHDAYYDYRTDTPDSDLDRIASMPVLFKIAVRHMVALGPPALVSTPPLPHCAYPS